MSEQRAEAARDDAIRDTEPDAESLPEPYPSEIPQDPYGYFDGVQDDVEDEGAEGPSGISSPSAALAKAAGTGTFETGMCLKFVRSMYGVPPKYPSAAVAWQETKRRGRSSPPPRGVPVWWTGGSRGFGHVAISTGDGYVISTDHPSRGRVGKVAIKAITTAWRQTYRGWSYDINGVTVYRDTRAAGYVAPPFPKGLAPGKRSPSAVPLQRALKAAGFMPKSVAENPNYGPKTQDAVAAFHDKYTQFKDPDVQEDVRIGPKGWAFLDQLAYG